MFKILFGRKLFNSKFVFFLFYRDTRLRIQFQKLFFNLKYFIKV